MRAVLDVTVLISALLSPAGSPARLLAAWRAGDFELIVSPLLLAELRRALAYPKLRKRVTQAEAQVYVEWLSRAAELAIDPDTPAPVRSPDPGDDYLVSLAASQNAILVSGDAHLLGLGQALPVRDPATFLSEVAGRPSS